MNVNHPKKGAIIKAEPIRSLADVEAIIVYLGTNLRNLALFVLGINTNLRCSDLLKLLVGDVQGATPGFSITLREKKTKKVRKITLNGKVCKALHAWLEIHPWADHPDAPLFPNLQTGQALTVPAVSRLVKWWCRDVGLKGHYSAHTLRKTWGYMHRTVHGTDLPTLVSMFNHSSQRQTLLYLGIDEDDVREAYLKEI